MVRYSAVKAILNKLVRRFQEAYILSLRPKEISAMIRVKDEEEYLYVAVKSIIDQVEEAVIIENLSTDNTPAVVKSLCREFPSKVVCYKYPNEIRRIGRDNWELATKPFSRFSRHLLANYYNWSLRKCTRSYILKWDGDMIALDTFCHSLAEFRRSERQVMWFKGANVHPDLKHLIAPINSDLESFQSSLVAPTTLSNWMSAYTDCEPRLFPRSFARYNTAFWWCERLQSPFLDGEDKSCYALKVEDVCYLHMKYCKRNPYANFSDDFKRVIFSNIGRGDPINVELIETL